MLPKELEDRYLEVFWKQQRAQWENYVDGARHDLSAIDAEMFTLMSSPYVTFDLQKRRHQVLHSIAKRASVDKHSAVSRLRNKLDNRENYTRDIELPNRQDPARFRLLLAERIEEDVLELMELRNRLAQEQGYSSYPELVLSTEDLTSNSILSMLSNYLKENLSTAADLARCHDLSWDSWFSDLNAIGRVERQINPHYVVADLLTRLGFERLIETIPLVVLDQGLSGYVGVISVPDDVRILIRPVNSLNQQLILFHELGHAVAHVLNDENGVFRTWTSVHDETMAAMFERIAASILLDEDQKKTIRELWILENTRIATSALFEMALWKQPSTARELYFHYYGCWNLPIDSPRIWAADSFRSIDSVYIHNYIVGAIVADMTIEILAREHGDEFRKWGKWLHENFYFDGRKRSLKEKAIILGEWIGGDLTER